MAPLATLCSASGEAVASWVQAIGSILAIVAGFAVVRQQAGAAHRENMMLAVAEVQNSRRAAISIAQLAQDMCEAVLLELRTTSPLSGTDVQRMKRGVEYQRNTIAAFPLWSLRNEEMMRCFAPLASILDYIADNLREVADTTGKGEPASIEVVNLVVGRINPLRDQVAANLDGLRTLAMSTRAALAD